MFFPKALEDTNLSWSEKNSNMGLNLPHRLQGFLIIQFRSCLSETEEKGCKMNHPHFLCGPTALENLAFRSHSRFTFQQGLWWASARMEHAFLKSRRRARQQSSLFLSLECLTHVCIQVPSASDFVYKPHGPTAYTPTMPSSYLSLSELGKLHSIELFTGWFSYFSCSFFH